MSAAVASAGAGAKSVSTRRRRRRMEQGNTDDWLDVERSSLHRALDEGRYQSVVYQVKLGMDPNVRSRQGLTPLMRCAQVRPLATSLQLICALLERGANPDLTDAGGNNLLQVAVREGNAGLVRLLLTENNVNFHHRNADGDTVLHLLARQTPELCRLVLRAARRFHIDCDLGNADGLTPLMAACRAGNLAVAELFVSLGDASFTKRDERRRRTAHDWLRASLGPPTADGLAARLRQQGRQIRLPAASDDPYAAIRESRRIETLTRLFHSRQSLQVDEESAGGETNDENEKAAAATSKTAASGGTPTTMIKSDVESTNDAAAENRSNRSLSVPPRNGRRGAGRVSQARMLSGIFGAYELQLSASYRRPAVPLPPAEAAAAAAAVAAAAASDNRPGSRLSSGRSLRSPVSGNSGGGLGRRMTEITGAGLRIRQRIRSGVRMSDSGPESSSLLLNTSQDSGGMRRLSSRI